METFLEILERLREDMSEAKGVLIGEIILIIGWIYYLIQLDKLNEILKEYYLSSDGVVARAFKIVFSEQNSSIMAYLLGGIILLFFLVGVVVYSFKQGYIWLSFMISLINLILIIFVLNSLLAPILISVALVLIIAGIGLWAFSNN